MGLNGFLCRTASIISRQLRKKTYPDTCAESVRVNIFSGFGCYYALSMCMFVESWNLDNFQG